MRRRIVDFHQDDDGAWVAELDCGHARHVRHDPPWEVRPWVLTAAGRASRLGRELECGRCAAPSVMPASEPADGGAGPT
ncbi:MAG TPA: DUF3565 domain-containing protein [Gemmatimonadales bacterium]|nr:DUF3565 domain-containing protein [Gemmatimonadales bacterium]